MTGTYLSKYCNMLHVMFILACIYIDVYLAPGVYITSCLFSLFYRHNLPDRLQKGEEIFFFCFYFLKYIQEEEFVVHFNKP